MNDIRDSRGHLVCRIEPESGLVESSYKKQITKTHLHIGGSISIERNRIITTVKRTAEEDYEVESFTKTI